jgi:hypothetical protein
MDAGGTIPPWTQVKFPSEGGRERRHERERERTRGEGGRRGGEGRERGREGGEGRPREETGRGGVSSREKSAAVVPHERHS